MLTKTLAQNHTPLNLVAILFFFSQSCPSQGLERGTRAGTEGPGHLQYELQLRLFTETRHADKGHLSRGHAPHLREPTANSQAGSISGPTCQ